MNRIMIVIAAAGLSAMAAAQDTDVLRLRVVDAEGDPVTFAQVGRFLDWSYPELPTLYLTGANEIPVTSDDAGLISIRRSQLFGDSNTDEDEVRLFVLGPDAKRIGSVAVTRADFGEERPVELGEGAQVGGELTHSALDDGLTWGSVGLVGDGDDVYGTAEATKAGEYTYLLPPGDYTLRAWGGTQNGDRFELIKDVKVAEGDKKLVVNFDLADAKQPEAEGGLPKPDQPQIVGELAPELTAVKEWSTDTPVMLASLRGKVVLIDFWGYWCGPCIHSMPRLMAMHDAFAEHGLVIIGIHEGGSIDSLGDLPALLSEAKESLWSGRDIPFIIGLDGGDAPSGDTVEAYGVRGFPTTFLIDREGIVAESFHPSNPSAWRTIEEMLGVEAAEPAAAGAAPGPAAAKPDEGDTAPQWFQAFRNVYLLRDGAVIKYVYPPFIAQRRDYVESVLPDVVADAGRPPDFLVMDEAEVTNAAWPPRAYGYLQRLPLSLVLEQVIGIESWRVTGDGAILNADVMGDWIIDGTASQAELVGDLQKLLREQLGVPVTVTKDRRQLDVIAVRGENGNPIETSGGDQEQAIADFCDRLSRATGAPVYNEVRYAYGDPPGITLGLPERLAQMDVESPEFEELVARLDEASPLEVVMMPRTVEVWWFGRD